MAVLQSQITIVGNAVGDARLIEGRNGDFAAFQIASNRRRFDREANQWENDPDGTVFFDVTANSGIAGEVARTVRKGIGLVVVGSISPKSFTTKDGVEVQTLKVSADLVAVTVLPGRHIDVTRRAETRYEDDEPAPASRQSRTRPAPAPVEDDYDQDEAPAPKPRRAVKAQPAARKADSMDADFDDEEF